MAAEKPHHKNVSFLVSFDNKLLALSVWGSLFTTYALEGNIVH